MSSALEKYVAMIQEEKKKKDEIDEKRKSDQSGKHKKYTVHFENLESTEKEKEALLRPEDSTVPSAPPDPDDEITSPDSDNEKKEKEKKEEEKPPKIMPKPVAATPHCLDDGEARQAFLFWVGQHCCYGRGVAANMTIQKMKPTSVYQYILETFCEQRVLEWSIKPYRGTPYEPTDGAEGCNDPDPWQIEAPIPEMFKDGISQFEVPYTAYLKTCHKCRGEGQDKCETCQGRGKVSCSMCDGTGKRTPEDRCNYCYGTGKRTCKVCSGESQVECSVCQGCRRVRHFLSLKIVRHTHKADFIDDTTDLPKLMVREAAGEIIFMDSDEIIEPINNFPVKLINAAAIEVVERAKNECTNQHILMQRQTVRSVPVTMVHYSWHNQSNMYYIYGYRKKVHHNGRYPQSICLCCSLL